MGTTRNPKTDTTVHQLPPTVKTRDGVEVEESERQAVVDYGDVKFVISISRNIPTRLEDTSKGIETTVTTMFKFKNEQTGKDETTTIACTTNSSVQDNAEMRVTRDIHTSGPSEGLGRTSDAQLITVEGAPVHALNSKINQAAEAVMEGTVTDAEAITLIKAHMTCVLATEEELLDDPKIRPIVEKAYEDAHKASAGLLGKVTTLKDIVQLLDGKKDAVLEERTLSKAERDDLKLESWETAKRSARGIRITSNTPEGEAVTVSIVQNKKAPSSVSILHEDTNALETIACPESLSRLMVETTEKTLKGQLTQPETDAFREAQNLFLESARDANIDEVEAQRITTAFQKAHTEAKRGL